MNYIILDLEATCWKDRNNGKPNEIIEIGALKIDENGKTLSEFSRFVKPKLNPILSDFCMELTTISQSEIDSAKCFPEVLKDFHSWIGLDKPYFLCSWGFYDKKQFKLDCQLHGLETDWLKNHISVKHQFAKIKQLTKPVGMATALKIEGIPLEGTHHRGIDDARNIAKIFVKNLQQWKFE